MLCLRGVRWTAGLGIQPDSRCGQLTRDSCSWPVLSTGYKTVNTRTLQLRFHGMEGQVLPAVRIRSYIFLKLYIFDFFNIMQIED